MKSLFAAALASLILAGAATAADWSPDRAASQTLAGGHAWSEVAASTGDASLIHAAIDVPAPPKIVWTVITDCRFAARLVPRLISCKTLDGDIARGWTVRESITHTGLFLPNIRNVARNDYQPYTLIRFHRVAGDLKIEDGEWRLTALAGGGTRVIYVNRVAASIAAPAPLVRAIVKHDTAQVMENLRREAVALAREKR